MWRRQNEGRVSSLSVAPKCLRAQIREGNRLGTVGAVIVESDVVGVFYCQDTSKHRCTHCGQYMASRIFVARWGVYVLSQIARPAWGCGQDIRRLDVSLSGYRVVSYHRVVTVPIVLHILLANTDCLFHRVLLIIIDISHRCAVCEVGRLKPSLADILAPNFWLSPSSPCFPLCQVLLLRIRSSTDVSSFKLVSSTSSESSRYKAFTTVFSTLSRAGTYIQTLSVT